MSCPVNCTSCAIVGGTCAKPKRTWRVHKVYGSVRTVVVNADIANMQQGGTLAFWDKGTYGFPTILVAAYPAHAWRFCEEIEE